MSRLWKILLGLVILVAVLVGAGAMAARSMISGSGKQRLLATLSDSLGVAVTVGTVDVHLGSLVKLEPALELAKISLANPPGFSAKPMVEADSIDAIVSIRSLFSSSPRIIALAVTNPTLLVEKNAAGKTNLEVFMDRLEAQSAAPGSGGGAPSSGSSLSIEDLRIEGGSLKLAGEALGSWRRIDLRIAGFGSGRPLTAKASARLLETKQSLLEFQGTVGPFAQGSTPVDGKLDLAFAPAELPKGFLLKEFGSFLAAPGDKALMKLSVALKGDLARTASGPTQLTLTDFLIGRDEQHRLPLTGSAAGQVTVKHALSGPSIQVEIPKSTLGLAGGQLASTISLLSDGGQTRAALAGSLKGLDIQQLLGAFMESDAGVQGALHIPRFEFRTQGRDANQMKAALTGAGALELANGKLKQMDLLGSITGAMGKAGLMKATGGTDFTTFKTNFAIENQVLTLTDAVMDGGGLRTTGTGRVGFDTSLNLKLQAQVSGRIAELLGARPRGDQPAQSTIPVDVAGTTANPRVTPSVKGLAAEATKNYVGGMLDKLLNKKK
ncbi:AsmA-like C-terminal region-containing protein [uncultured Paludibaculum sp.]|uniref:AsmA family protein n=1 Tax=uncultured Paludibaculum sp. TaxID=1765020 RepID=UPI002AABAC30|nr:AsmA-like C-terminal region-containing protein [uncultured Paludibaculum sp.]